MSLSLKMLGGFVLRDGAGADLSLPTRKIRALLSYLAVNADKPQPRERLMALLWSDRSERQARQSLNQSLMSIRRLGAHEGVQLLDSDGERVTLRGDAVACDVLRLRSLMKDSPAEAAILYDGPFLDGLSVPDPAFDEWLLAMRSEMHALACDALEAAANSADDTGTAIDCAKRLAMLDPLREEAHRRLMQLLHQSGDRAGALRQYQTCAEILKRELQVGPEPATQALFHEIRRNALSETETHPPIGTDIAAEIADKRSIAVLPFDNLGVEPQAEDLAYGLADDLITALSKVPQLIVVPRQPTMIYKNQNVNIQQAAYALGVHYVVTGSIRTASQRMRCSVQLIDVARGRQVWAERYDRPIDDVFAVSDDTVRQILIELQVRLTSGESIRVTSRGTRDLEAWLLFIQGHAEGNKFARESIIRARELFEAAQQADPDWAIPLAMIAWTHFLEAQREWSDSREESIRLGMELAQRAIKMDPNHPWAYRVLNGILFLVGDYDEGIALAEKSAKLAPNDSLTLAGFAYKLLLVDDIDRALEFFERARRICAVLPEYQLRRYGLLLQLAGQTEKAVEVLEGLTRSAPDFLYGHIQLAAAYVEIRQFEAARASVRRVIERDSSFNIELYLKTLPFKKKSRLEWLRGLLLKAGLPE